MLETQLVALEELTAFPFEDPLLGAILRGCRIDVLEPKYREPDLLVATAKAFGSITNARTHALWSSLLIQVSSFIPIFLKPKIHLKALKNSLRYVIN